MRNNSLIIIVCSRMSPSVFDSNSQQKTADPTFNSFHSHQHGFIHSHSHSHGFRPVQEFNEFSNHRPVTNVIQTQQTIVSPSNPHHHHHHDTFGGGEFQHSGGNWFPTRPSHIQQHIPNNHISINQNQVIGHNLLRSQPKEEEFDKNNNFMSATEFDHPDDKELVSKNVIFKLKFLLKKQYCIITQCFYN